MRVSVIVPTLNEAGSIGEVLKVISGQKVDEILVVDGHSTDETDAIVKKLGYRLIFQKGKGLGKAIESGIKNTTGDVIIIVDADGSHDPRDIAKLMEKIRQGYDLVVASRYISGPTVRGLFKGMFFPKSQSTSYDDTFTREIGNRMFSYMCRVFYKIEIHDSLMGFKAFRRAIFDKVRLVDTGQEFDVEILIKSKKAGFRIGEVSVIEHKRVYGKSKLSVPYHGFKVLWVILRELFSAVSYKEEPPKKKRRM